ncbi:hypothetical protein UO65_4806 [Actinokineospora spheciospongiae]|uniref:Uncharacterized protein n=1 Tax=Actinokineospora spheciospongiae TaxID=909613 RepID=W7IU84_9PSEU|nr:hypothetical protein UO65_4806 [Actinokineospora spheciospongiae]
MLQGGEGDAVTGHAGLPPGFGVGPGRAALPWALPLCPCPITRAPESFVRPVGGLAPSAGSPGDIRATRFPEAPHPRGPFA